MANCCFCKKVLDPEDQVIIARAKTTVKQYNPLHSEAHIKIWEASSCSEGCMMFWMMKNYFEDMQQMCYQQVLEDHEIEDSLDDLILVRSVLKHLETKKEKA